jgi:pimeloyl-ACP methyl ester carboxylesterase
VPRRAPALTAVTAAAALLTTLAVGASSAVAQPAGDPGRSTARLATALAWQPCADEDLDSAGARCATFHVPLDYKKPGGPTISLALSMVKHTSTAAAYQGVMLVNPGGPGGSGIGLATLGQYLPHNAGSTYDWIGFDPRGVGSSRPSLRCSNNFFHCNRVDYVPSTRSIESSWIARTKAYAAACDKHGGSLLAHLRTIDTVHDMDAIRRALGVSTLNFYGFSYGTYLGQVYATLFPTHVRRMVLDSNVDPRRVWYAANLDQDVAFEKTMSAWYTWLAKHDATYRLGKTESAVERLFFAQQAALDRKPAGGVVGSDEWNDIFLSAGYYQFTWPELGALFANWVHVHHSAPLVSSFLDTDTPGDDNEYAVYDAVQCTDAPWPKSWSTWRTDNDRIYRSAPFLTWSNAWYNAPCRTWSAKPGTPVKVNGTKAPAILLVDETLDAATPYSGSLWVRHLFPRSRLISVIGGTSHANSLNGNACVDNAIAAYLAHGTLPVRQPGAGRSDRDCRPLPQPTAGTTFSVTRSGQHVSPFAQLARVPVRQL